MKIKETIAEKGIRLIGQIRLIGHIGHISHISHISLIILISLIGLASCSSGEEPAAPPAAMAAEIEVASYATLYEDANGTSRANATAPTSRANATATTSEAARTAAPTRAWDMPTGYTTYDDGDQPIGIAFTQDGKEPKMGHFFKSSDKWRTNISEITAGDYYLYGYIPNMAGIVFRVTDKTGGIASYSTGAKVTLQNVPTIMPGDLCVVIGAKDGTDKEHDNGLKQGDFKFNAKAITSTGGTDNFVFLLFDHLYAALRIKMKVYGDYAALRTIKLKSLQLSTKAGDETTKQKNNITITLNHNDEGGEAIEDINYEQTGAAIDGGTEFWSSIGGEQLTTDYTTHEGHFMPQAVSTLKLTSIYDVYDRRGNLIRKDCKVTNTMVLNELLTDQYETYRGRRYTVNMTIRPTYLYMLSEPDLDSPTVTLDL